MGKKRAVFLALSLFIVALAGIKFYQSKAFKAPKAVEAAQNLPPEIQKLKNAELEIGKLTDEAIMEQANALRTKLMAGNLAKRMKENQLEGQQKEEVKDMLVRLSLLEIEKNKRLQLAR